LERVFAGLSSDEIDCSYWKNAAEHPDDVLLRPLFIGERI
jgi:hypothetical protein